MAASRNPDSLVSSLTARAAAASACSQRTPSTWPRPRVRPARQKPASTRAVAGPTGALRSGQLGPELHGRHYQDRHRRRFPILEQLRQIFRQGGIAQRHPHVRQPRIQLPQGRGIGPPGIGGD